MQTGRKNQRERLQRNTLAQCAMDRCWASLVDEVLIQIFSKLRFYPLLNVSHVCRSWRRVAHFAECWDHIHISHHQRFLDVNIKGIGIPFSQASMSKESDCVIRRCGVTAKSIFVSPTADDYMIQMIAHRCPDIESLSVRDCKRMSPNALLKLIRTCKNLKLIDMYCCPAVFPSVIKEMGQSCTKLVGLNLGGREVTIEMAIAIGEFMPKLKWLSLNCATISSATLCSILGSCKELEYVSVELCRGLLIHDEIESRASGIAEFKHSHYNPADPELVEFYHGTDLGYP